MKTMKTPLATRCTFLHFIENCIRGSFEYICTHKNCKRKDQNADNIL